MTAAQARRHHQTSCRDRSCPTHSDTLTQHRNASDTFASEEQAGSITILPETSAKLMTMPERAGPRSHRTSDASTSKKILAKNEKSRRLQSMGTVSASMISAPRLRTE